MDEDTKRYIKGLIDDLRDDADEFDADDETQLASELRFVTGALDASLGENTNMLTKNAIKFHVKTLNYYVGNIVVVERIRNIKKAIIALENMVTRR